MEKDWEFWRLSGLGGVVEEKHLFLPVAGREDCTGLEERRGWDVGGRRLPVRLRRRLE